MELIRKLWWIIPITGLWLVFGGCNRNSVQKSMYRGIEAMEKGNHTHAAQEFQEALNQEPSVEDAAKIYNYLGLAQWENKNLDRAAAAFEESIDLAPSFEAMYNRGLVVREQGLHNMAAEYFENAASRDSQDPRANEMLAALCIERGDRDCAMQQYQEALRRRPGSPRILTSMASVHLQDKRPQEAQAALSQAIDRSPGYAPALYNLAQLFEQQSYLDDARNYYARHIEAESKPVWRERSEAALARLGGNEHVDEESTALARARQEGGGTSDAPLASGSRAGVSATGLAGESRSQRPSRPAATPSRKTADLLEAAKRAADEGNYSSAVGICLSVASRSQRAGDAAGAESAYRRAVELVPNNASARVALARMLEENGDVEEAYDHYKKATEIHPDFPPALEGFARTAIAKFEYGEARDALRTAVRLQPAKADTLWMLCEHRYKNIRSNEHTRESLQTFLERFPEHEKAATARAWLAELPAPSPVSVMVPGMNPDGTAAPNMRHEILSIRPMVGDEQPGGVGLARFTSTRTLTPALPELSPDEEEITFVPAGRAIPAVPRSRTTENGKREPDANEYFQAGVELFRHGRFSDAKQALEDATRLNPKLVDAHMKLAEIYRGEDNDNAEKSRYYRVLRVAPEHLGARYQLGRVHHRSGNLNEAFMQFSHVLAKQPDNPDLHYYLGDLEVRLNKNRRAASKHYSTFLKLAPDDPRADTVKDWIRRNS